MPRIPSQDDPLAAARRAVRRVDLRGEVEIALFRLPVRQREIVRRYDFARQEAHDVQRALGLSRRQFFRDHRQALSILSAHLTCEEGHGRGEAGYRAGQFALGCDIQVAGRAFARGLAQSGSLRSLDVLRSLAANTGAHAQRADLLLELADTAADYGDTIASTDAMTAASQLLGHECRAPAAWLHGRLARVRARLAQNSGDAAAHLARAIALLRGAVALDLTQLDVRVALADTLGAGASFHFEQGNYAHARAASREAAEMVERFELRWHPKAVETLALHAAIDACLTGRTKAAIANISSLLRLAAESAWSSTACRLGGYLVGLNDLSEEYTEAISWYRRTMPTALAGARPIDRADLVMEAAHAYTMSGRASEALSVLATVRPPNGRPRHSAPSWRAVAAEALAHLGDESAIAEAHAALVGYTKRNAPRGIGDAHRLLAVCYAKRGDARRAREHVAEARKLTERYGVPYALLLTLVAEAAIVRSVALRREASEYAKLLRRLAST